jgi:hypothetical protein
MLREIVAEEEIPGDFQTTFRVRVDGSAIAENVTELETQFLVSEVLERIPSLRSASKRRRRADRRHLAAGTALEGVQRRATQFGAIFYAQPPDVVV